jgi:hypothetical protein
MTSVYDIPEHDVDIFFNLIRRKIPNSIEEKYTMLYDILSTNEYTEAPESISDWIFAKNILSLNLDYNLPTVKDINIMNGKMFSNMLNRLGLPNYLDKKRLLQIIKYLGKKETILPMDTIVKVIENLDYESIKNFCNTSKHICSDEIKNYINLPKYIDKENLSVIKLFKLSKIMTNIKTLFCDDTIYAVSFVDGEYEIYRAFAGGFEFVIEHDVKIKDFLNDFDDSMLILDVDGNCYTERDEKKILLDNNLEQITFGGNHKIKLYKDGNVYGVGAFYVGENDPVLKINPDKVLLDNVIQIASGSDHCLFLTNEGDVFGCGSNSVGQLATNFFYEENPVKLTTPPNIIKIFASKNISILLDQDLKCYLAGSFSLEESDEYMRIGRFVQIDKINNVVDVVIGENLILFLTQEGNVLGIGPFADKNISFNSEDLNIKGLTETNVERVTDFKKIIYLFDNTIEIQQCSPYVYAKRKDNTISGLELSGKKVVDSFEYSFDNVIY